VKLAQMTKTNYLTASGILFLIAFIVFAFTFYFFHFIRENGLPGRQYYKNPNKPFISLLFGVLGTVLFAAAIVCLVFGLVMQG
jgi:heme/copper-type cytochrome/quinol oxidase subunit 1